jgi:hypothetical protein
MQEITRNSLDGSTPPIKLTKISSLVNAQKTTPD